MEEKDYDHSSLLGALKINFSDANESDAIRTIILSKVWIYEHNCLKIQTCVFAHLQEVKTLRLV